MKKSEIKKIEAAVKNMTYKEMKARLEALENIKGEMNEELEITYSFLYDRVLEFDVDDMTLTEALQAYNKAIKDGSGEGSNLECYLQTKIMNEFSKEDFNAIVDLMIQRTAA